MQTGAQMMFAQKPPPLPLLLALNILVSFSSFLVVLLCNSYWTVAGWSPWEIGLGMTAANLSYGALVHQGGRLAERIGRTRSAIIGALVCATGAALPIVHMSAWTSVAAGMLAFGGTAFYFPGIAGLFSDSSTANVPLHRKVSRYNLGWASGCLAGFVTSGLVARLPIAAGLSIGLCGFALVAIALWRWRSLPPLPPPATGDRSGHPALAYLTLLHRCSLTIGTMIGLALISLMQRALEGSHHALLLKSVTLSAYALGYVSMFFLLGYWSGWILKPWRLWWIQFTFLIGSLGFAALPHYPTIWGVPVFAVFGVLVGVGYATVYTPSIFYSMRIPQGASRAAGLHETFLGAGNALGPLLAGIFVQGALALSHGSLATLTALGAFCVLATVILQVFQAIMIPKAVRLGAK